MWSAVWRYLTRRKISSSLLIRSSSSCDASSAMTWHLIVVERTGREVLITMLTCPKVAKVSPYLDCHLASCRRMVHPWAGMDATSNQAAWHRAIRDAKQGPPGRAYLYTVPALPCPRN